jgi:hypothetical protein
MRIRSGFMTNQTQLFKYLPQAEFEDQGTDPNIFRVISRQHPTKEVYWCCQKAQ